MGWLLYRLMFSSLSKIPGPWYTNLSVLFLVYHEYRGSKRLWIHNLHLKYGESVRIAPNELSFASATAIKEIYTSAGGYAKTELYSLFQHGPHRNLFTALDKKEHNEKKKRLADRYSNSAVLQPGIQALLRDRADAFARVCAVKKTLDVYLYLHCYALDCVSAIVFDPYGTRSIEEGNDNDMVRHLSYHNSRPGLVIRHYLPWLHRFYSRFDTRTQKGGEMIDEYAWASIRKEPHSVFTLSTRLLQYPEIGTGNMVAECLDHIGAGIDTTGDALCFLMWEISQPHNSKKMQRLCEELRMYSLENGDTLIDLPYLNAIVQETMRLWAPGTQSLPRYVPDGGRCIDGHFVPGHTIVSAQSFTVHRMDQTIFPDSEAFNPERWLEIEGKVERQRLMFAFGSGARTCLGKFLAMSEMRLLLHAVYSRFRTRPADDMNASMEMSDQLMTSRPKDMLCKLTFEPIEL
ncbi:hypothetical protein LCP963914a_8641 [Penicillium roqueforti]|nr:hypothetical protein LCP963914a_8641 [Penicillium roqueforti]